MLLLFFFFFEFFAFFLVSEFFISFSGLFHPGPNLQESWIFEFFLLFCFFWFFDSPARGFRKSPVEYLARAASGKMKDSYWDNLPMMDLPPPPPPTSKTARCSYFAKAFAD